MHCANCDSTKSKILWSRRDSVESKVRKRQCLDCDYAWYTLEMELPEGAVAQGTAGAVNRRPGFQRVTFS
jgi:transcriptional regulator NrdR family protein